MEAEDQILRQQALLNSPVRKMSEHLAITTPVENGHHVSEENKVLYAVYVLLLPLLYSPERGVYLLQEPQSAAPAKKFGSESMRRSQIERQHVCT